MGEATAAEGQYFSRAVGWIVGALPQSNCQELSQEKVSCAAEYLDESNI